MEDLQSRFCSIPFPFFLGVGQVETLDDQGVNVSRARQTEPRAFVFGHCDPSHDRMTCWVEADLKDRTIWQKKDLGFE